MPQNKEHQYRQPMSSQLNQLQLLQLLQAGEEYVQLDVRPYTLLT